MDTAKGFPNIYGLGDIHMGTAKPLHKIEDLRMETAKFDDTTIRKNGGGLKLWEREIVENPEVKRKATVAQLCESVFS